MLKFFRGAWRRFVHAVALHPIETLTALGAHPGQRIRLHDRWYKVVKVERSPRPVIWVSWEWWR